MKIIKVHDCDQCYYADGEDELTNAWCHKRNRMLDEETYPVIPIWCPLSDAPKKDKSGA